MESSPLGIEDRFNAILLDVLDDSTFDPQIVTAAEDAITDDSLSQLKLILAIEEEFAIKFSLSELMSLRSPQQFLAAIKRHIEIPLARAGRFSKSTQ